MIFLNSSETKEKIPLLLELDREVFGEQLLYKPSPEMMQRVCHPMNVLATAVDETTQKAVAYLAMVVVGESFYKKLCCGEAREEEAEPWDGEETPMLFIRDLVVRDRRATPYIFRYALKDLQQLCVEYEIYLHRTFTVGSHWAMAKILKNYQFEEVGKYQGKYSIMMTSRDKSPVMNSFLKQY